jgi:hypothetical protein
MPIRPSVAQSHKHLILSQRSPRNFWIYLLTLKVYYYYFVYLLLFSNKFGNFIYEVTHALHKSFFPLALTVL